MRARKKGRWLQRSSCCLIIRIYVSQEIFVETLDVSATPAEAEEWQKTSLFIFLFKKAKNWQQWTWYFTEENHKLYVFYENHKLFSWYVKLKCTAVHWRTFSVYGTAGMWYGLFFITIAFVGMWKVRCFMVLCEMTGEGDRNIAGVYMAVESELQLIWG